MTSSTRGSPRSGRAPGRGATLVPIITIYASIGNSDDRLPQQQWSVYAQSFVTTIQRHVGPHWLPGGVHGEWYSLSNAPWQNACVCFEATADQARLIRADLEELRTLHDQDSVAWAEVTRTEFI